MRLALTYNAMGRYGDAATALAQALKVDPAYNGDNDKFVRDLKLRKLKATDAEEQDISDYLDILKY
jgi:predicted TPR repeat methyltransferase